MIVSVSRTSGKIKLTRKAKEEFKPKTSPKIIYRRSDHSQIPSITVNIPSNNVLKT